jgi:hypothetical protein
MPIDQQIKSMINYDDFMHKVFVRTLIAIFRRGVRRSRFNPVGTDDNPFFNAGQPENPLTIVDTFQRSTRVNKSCPLLSEDY